MSFQVGVFQTDFQQVLSVVTARPGGSSRRGGKRPPYWWERPLEETELPELPEFVVPPDPAPLDVMPPRIAFAATPPMRDLEAEQRKRKRMIAMAVAALMADDDE